MSSSEGCLGKYNDWLITFLAEVEVLGGGGGGAAEGLTIVFDFSVEDRDSVEQGEA